MQDRERRFMLFGQPIRQMGFFAEDVRESALEHSRRFGSGPFFVVPLNQTVIARPGEDGLIDMSCAVGQWGTMQVEFLQEAHGDHQRFRDMFDMPSDKTGIHHAAIIVDDLDAAVADFAKAGFREKLRFKPHGTTLTSVFIDTVAEYGFFIELYGQIPSLLKLYESVAHAAKTFDGTDPVREGRPAPIS